MKFRYLLILFAFLIALPQAVDAKKKKDVTIQLYSVRDLIKEGSDFNALLKKLAKMGYSSVEAANYNDGKFYGLTPEDFKKAVEDAGMTVLSSHCSRGLSDQELASGDFSESLKWWDQCIAAHKAAGMKYIVTPWLGVPKTVKDLQTYCNYFNEIGKRCKENGMLYGYHNHAHEFEKVEGKEVMYNYMLENTNPDYVFFQMDVYWVVRGQNSPVDYFKKYPGRFKILHIKDDRELGQSGMVGFDAIFKNAATAGVQNIVAEIERYSCPVEESVKESIDYLLDAPFVKASYRK
ncbi:Sugar phosphate isomerase/epimerase [Bacteroides faecichinchillae]|uniref:Sugar phosphate isomerase/epimerase n=1 Tax=Bacteroides faecichinchillae TaxID=871325 RepID=A0A1M5EDQ0_9BACE|nr:sugar phosphate isomerase/epimerase [Bacteroides faecichinchillae]THG68432.1 sugar phosphate isomerase/epimerase [Bacteroides faecichinchillae]SHF77201.1 Sugar phosphate isomerase/epimerase [Bacteroides faecichinchillae]